MIEVKTLAAIPQECQGYTGQRIKLMADGLVLWVPNLMEDTRLRYCLERGVSLKKAYGEVGISLLYPYDPIVPCVEEVLKTKYYDTKTGTWKTAGGQFTCIGFHKCITEYANALRKYPGAKRMEIAPGVFAPSPQEQTCIQDDYYRNKNLLAAYTRCGAGDILPGWSGALAFLSNALDTEPAGNLYEIIKTSYRLSTVTPTPTPPPTERPRPEPAKNWLSLFIIGGVAVYFFMSAYKKSH